MPRKIKIILIVFAILLVSIGCDIFFEVNFSKVNVVNVQSQKIAKGQEIKIVQISDLHNKEFFGKNVDLYKKIRQANPDFIVITGDLIDKNTKDYGRVEQFIKDLLKINKTIYFVSGDHEEKNIKNITKDLEGLGVKVLNREVSVFDKGGQKINIYGLDYFSDKSDINFIKNVPSKDYSILLVHNPDFVINNDIKIDLALSGDTHGGQIRLPIIGALSIPGQSLFPKYSKGLYPMSNGTILYIDSGLGETLIPVRFLDRSQISLIVISQSD
jgi:hypothetical protein